MRYTLVFALVVTLRLFAGESAPQVYDAWPFDATEAARRQSETAKAIGAQDPLSIAVNGGPALVFRLIPPGKFNQGSPVTENGHEGDETIKSITLTDAYYMMSTQLTVEVYRALMKTDPPGMPADADPKLPAAVTYRDAVDTVLPALAKLAPEGWKVILPDRARLENAARAGVAAMNPGGNMEKDADDYVWSKANSENKVHPVAQKKPNAWGLYDVLGNRWHWLWVGAGGGYADQSKDDHLVYGGTYNTPANGNGARLANIMISRRAEGVRYALIRSDSAVPKGHPETKK